MKVTVHYAEDYSGYTTVEVDVPAGMHPWHAAREQFSDIARAAENLEIDWNDPFGGRVVMIETEDGTVVEEPEESPSETDEYLVVALYDDNEQRFATSVVAKTPAEAEELAAAEAEGDITVAAVICKRTGEVVA